MKRILETVVKYGARPADPGEFTKRAFLNGRIDLSQAEAVIDVINAKNDYALRSSVSQLKGSVQKKISDIREKLIYHTAFIESALDDPEHISLCGYPQVLLAAVDQMQAEMKHLINSSDEGRIIQEGIKTVILGKPNAGKSSLMNLLVGEERAIVTEIPGTTRDLLEEHIVINGISLNIIDTAGIRNTNDVVEKIGVKKAKENALDADLIVYVVDSSRELDQSDEDIMEIIIHKKAVVLLNKTDLDGVITEDYLKTKLNKIIIPVSAKNETGIREFADTIKNMFFNGCLSFNDEVYITNIRHKNAILEAYESIKLVKKSIQDQMPEDFYSIDLMNAYEALGAVTGDTTGDDLVNEIFSKFCTGK